MNALYWLAYQISPNAVGIDKVNADNVVVGILNTAYFVGGIVAVVVIIIGGIMYATSNGDSGKTKSAREAIIYAVVGLGIILSAFVITGFVIGRF